jgi:hypothetical protein
MYVHKNVCFAGHADARTSWAPRSFPNADAQEGRSAWKTEASRVDAEAELQVGAPAQVLEKPLLSVCLTIRQRCAATRAATWPISILMSSRQNEVPAGRRPQHVV